MKKVLFGIFAHPDDEGFGPSATLYKATQAGADVHLILVTDGEAGRNPDNVTNLGEVRLKEWANSGKLIGVKSGHALHYPDGGLDNDLYLEIAQKILTYIEITLGHYHEPITVDFMTFDSGGISGHLDHIAVSCITTFVYLTLREQAKPNITLGVLKYFCLPKVSVPQANINWLYMPAGKVAAEIDEIVDNRDVISHKLEIMRAHHSQREDMKQVLALQESIGTTEHMQDHFHYFKD